MATMLDYIQEEEMVLKNILNKFELKKNEDFNKIKNLLILATGSSYNACLAAKVTMEKIANISITIEEPYNFNHYGKISESVDAVLAVSQSGKSTSTIDAIKHMKKIGILTMALTSNIESPISQVDHVFDLDMGIETVGFVTKGYSVTVTQLILLSMTIGINNGGATDKIINYYLEELSSVVQEIPSIINKTNYFFEKNQSIFKLCNRFVAIGYGPNWGTAKEFETKFTETVRKPSQGFELEAYMHGPYLEANHDHVLFFIDTQSVNLSRSNLLENYMRPHVGKTFVITTETRENENVLSLGIGCDELVSQLALVIPMQILSYKIATSKGIDLGVRIFDDFDSILKSKL
ncbi:SIS domain-containing protein [Vagococcus fluvialis]|uniref:SIS domain-containing protein n=1 Tax=Vagococcus fluvialis TaxID=2738 RepID=UPI003D10BA99